MSTSPKYVDNGKRNVVVVGGGYGAVAARSIATKLDASAYNLILIDARPYRIHLPATIRMIVSQQDYLETTAFVDYDKLFQNLKGVGRFIRAKVTSIEKGEKSGGTVTLENDEKVPYEVLVVATGSIWGGPLAFPDTADEVSQWLSDRRSEFSEAKNIVLVGAGAVGLELAGEVKDLWPDKPVTIVHAQVKVLNDAYPDKFRNRMNASITARGIEIIFGDAIDDMPAKGATSVTTRNGKVLKADLVVATWGGRPNTGLLKGLGPNVLASNECVKVRPTLQLTEFDDVFAMGDIIDVPEQKQAAKANYHASTVAANVLTYLRGSGKMKTYNGSSEMIVVTNGKHGGVTYLGILWGIVLGGWFSSLVKSKGLMISMFRSSMGY